MIFITASLFATFLCPRAYADPLSESPYDSHDVAVFREFRMAELGIEPVLEADGESYHYSLPIDLDTPEVLEQGALYYVYDGQQIYSSDSGPDRDEVSYIRPASHLTDISFDADSYIGVGDTVMVDAYGRRWLLSGYDDDALWTRLNAYDELVESTIGLEPDRQERFGIEYDPQAGERETSVLDTDLWITFDCAGDTDLEVEDHIYGGTTDALTLAGTLNVRQKKTVLVMAVGHSSGLQYMGSGVLVDDNTVLTAAHVIAGSSGYTDQVNMRVCSYGNVETGAQCRSVSGLSAPGGVYDGTVANDYGVIQLSSAYSPTIGWMAMSTASDTTLESATHFHEGYPAWQPTCDGNTTFNDANTIVDGSYLGINYATSLFEYFDYFGSWQMTAYGPVNDVRTGSVRFNVSSGGGMSGGPYYYCPSGCTETSGSHFITAITHGHLITSSTNGYTDGAKARDFRDWVIANM